MPVLPHPPEPPRGPPTLGRRRNLLALAGVWGLGVLMAGRLLAAESAAEQAPAVESLPPVPVLRRAIPIQRDPADPSTAAAEGDPPVAIRVTWGGGKPRAWSGSIRIVDETPGLDAPTAVANALGVGPAFQWRHLSPDSLAPARISQVGGGLAIRQPAVCPLDGVEILVPEWSTARIVIDLVADGRLEEQVRLEIPVADLLIATWQQPLDDEANRLIIRRTPGDELRVKIPGGAIRVPGETIKLQVHPLLPERPPGATTVELRLKLRDSAGADLISRTQLVHPSQPRDGAPGGPQRFDPVAFDLPLPAREGALDIVLELVERGGLRWARPLATRTVQVVAVTAAPPRVLEEEEWRVAFELDPTSPKLMDRLRRLPGVGRSAASGMSFPHVPMPMVTIPKVPLPAVTIPKLPSVSAVVPRLTGLLSSGHSMLEFQPAGAVFRLPPARSPGEPSWEAIHLAGVQPGMPQVIEIDHPQGEDSIVGLTVLEQVGGGVQATFSGGFTVEAAAGSKAMGRHRCVFWPHTRTPLVVISNTSLRQPAYFGTVRILAGPASLPAPPTAVRSESRRLYGFLPEPDFSGFGGVQRVDASSGRTESDWGTFLVGVRTSAGWLASQGAAGAMVAVYGDGAPLWRSGIGGASPRWDSGGTFDAALDHEPKDILPLLCRIYRRHALRLVPAITCNGPLAAIETLLASTPEKTAGLVCVGRDGRPRRSEPSSAAPHYNILDPRVQDAIESIVAELLVRVSGDECVDGLAMILPDDGWLHLPGTAWGLDDVTFSRFLADSPAAEVLASAGGGVLGSEPQRFARRAALVEGPLREVWLDWRAEVVAEFLARLAERISAENRSWTLSVVPTTLFTRGELAPRFRPVLASAPADADICREIGIDPLRLARHPALVWVAPHVQAANDCLVERDELRAANSSPSVAGAGRAGTGRRAMVAIDQPGELDLRSILAHGPFGGAPATGRARVHAVRTGNARARMLAESQRGGDLETIYDGGLAYRQGDDADQRLYNALGGLPAVRLSAVASVPRPLVVSTGADDALGSGILVTNAGQIACRAVLDIPSGQEGLVDGADRQMLAANASGEVVIQLAPWQTRSLVSPGRLQLRGVSVDFDPGLESRLAGELTRLRRRRFALEMPAPLAVLDNPAFEVPDHGGEIPGWQLLEPTRGRLRLVSGAPDGSGRGAAFSSDNGLATLQSNPFPPPATGRISVGLWMRIDPGEPQPPLRVAIEGLQDNREYYRFAAVGLGPGTRPLTPQWAQFVLQVDDLPTQGLESLRVRLDLLAGGTVQIDDVRVFDLAFDESQRVQLTKALTLADQHLADGDLGACLADLDAHWPRFLDAFVTAAADQATDGAVASSHSDGDGHSGSVQGTNGTTQPGTEPAKTGLIDRLRRWWQ